MNLPSRKTRSSRRARRRGIALIFVLGCLAMVVIAAISFASFMKTERLVAAQSLELSRARQAAMAGLERAIDRLNRGAGTTDYVYDLGGGGTNYWPRSDVYYQLGGDTRFRLPSGSMGRDGSMTFLGRDQITGLPVNLLPDYFTADLLLNTPPTPSRTTGAAVSIIANLSGRIDVGALRAAPSVTRNLAGGIDASALLSAIGGPTQAQIATNSRQNTMLDYYTMPEVRYLGGVTNKLSTAAKESSFSMFEQACQMYLSTSTRTKAYVPCFLLGPGFTDTVLATIMANPGAAGLKTIGVGFADALVTAGVPQKFLPYNMSGAADLSNVSLQTNYELSFLNNVRDYIDPDFDMVHNDLQLFCGEPLPMFNEVALVVANLPAVNTPYASNLVSTVSVVVEFVYPLTSATDPSNYQIEVVHSGSTGGTISTPLTFPVVVPGNSPARSAAGFFVATGQLKIDLNPMETISELSIALRLKRASGGMIVDQVGTVSAPLRFTNLNHNDKKSREARDARLNYFVDPYNAPSTGSNQIMHPGWAPVGNTTTNAINATVLTNPKAMAEYPYVVHNRPFLNVAELGYIAFGNVAYQTVSLVADQTLAAETPPLVDPDPAADGPVHRVLDTFTFHPGYSFQGVPLNPSTNVTFRASPLVRGLVNLNTRKQDVLASAILSPNIDWPNSRILAGQILAARPASSYSRKSEVGALMTSKTETMAEFDLQQFMDLCDVRGNTFVVLVRGYGVIDNGPVYGPPLAGNDALTSSVELVAHVWRDPQTRRTQIRSLKWVDLDDDSVPNL